MSPGAEPKALPMAPTADWLSAVDTPDAASVGARSATVGTMSVRLSEADVPDPVTCAEVGGGGGDEGREDTAANAPAAAIAMPIPGAIQRAGVAAVPLVTRGGADPRGVIAAGVGFGVTQDRGSNDGS